jgi:flagellar biosynthesis/type III secretory pathway M-ring protein FliF/YscJ
MNRLLILGILSISTAPLFAQAQQPNAAELAQKVVSIISGDKAKIQTHCQILDLSDELDQTDQQKDREKTEELSQKINELQKNLAPNTSRCSRLLRTWIQIPKTVRRSCRSSISLIVPARTNSDVLVCD